MMRPFTVSMLAVSLLIGTTRAQETPSILLARPPAMVPTAVSTPDPVVAGALPAGDQTTGTAPLAAPAQPGAASSPSASVDPGQASHPDSLDFFGITPRAGPKLAVRFGWWDVHNDGSTIKTGEFQDLHSSPFYDVDGLFTTGTRTLNFTVTGLDNEANYAATQIYGPHGRVNVEFERFIRERDNVPLTHAIQSIVNPDLFVTNGIVSNRPVTANPTPVLVQDLGVGQNYAFRIEELKAEVVQNLTDNVKFRVQVFQMRKFGERQATAMARCFHPPEFGTTGPLRNIRGCHILSQPQQIDWTTTEVTPRLEGRWGPVTIEYAHQMRFFGQNDQIVTRLENGTGTGLIQGNLPYAVVPESTTHIDQLRLGLDLTDHTRLYSFGYAGNTVNEDRGNRRDYLGYDVRLTDRTFKGLLLTAYTKGYHQNGTRPTFFLPEEAKGVTETGPTGTTILKAGEDAIRDPLEYHRTTAGVTSRWQPGLGDGLWQRTAFLSGYEYQILNREGAEFETIFLRDRARTLGIIEFSQPSTITNQIYAGVQQPWTDSLDTEVRYKVFFIHEPLHGFREISGYVNSNLPEEKHVLEFFETWRPLPNLGFLCQQDIDIRRHNDDTGPVIPQNVINFNEQSYSFVNSVWYAPTPKLALTANASWMSNWINQIINLGDEYVDPTQPPPPAGGTVPTDSRRWYYGGRAVVLGNAVDYRLTKTVWLHGGYEWVRGEDLISTRNLQFIGAGRPGAQPWTDLPLYSKVLVVTQRITAGIDWKPRERMSFYFRYNYFDFDDKAADFNSGTAHMFLAGGSYVW